MALLSFEQHVIAHRGASAVSPENTMAAFQKACDLGISWIELDVALTKDKCAIIIHDDTLDRTTNGHGEVSDYPLAELEKLDAGSWFSPIFQYEKLPTLKKLLPFLVANQLKANVELKSLPGREKELVLAVLEDMSEHLMQHHDDILFSSFSVPTLTWLRQYAPTVQIGLLMEEWLPDWEVIASQLNCKAIHVDKTIVTKERAAEVKAQGWQFLCYTVDDPIEAKRLLNMGIDAIFTNEPDQVLKLYWQRDE